MSAPRTARTAAGAVTAAAVSAAVLLGLGNTAAAGPPATELEPCGSTLSRVTQWPGTLGDGSLRFSDAYERYLLRQPSCNPGR